MSRNQLLVIDDEEDVRRSLGLLFSSVGYQVSLANSAITPQEAALLPRPDLIICGAKVGSTAIQPNLPQIPAAFGEVTAVCLPIRPETGLAKQNWCKISSVAKLLAVVRGMLPAE